MGKTLTEIFRLLREHYEADVAKADEAGFAALYKEAADTYFQTLKEIGFHATDIEYLDGYFIFGHGTNSIVHFHIKECPGWKFGIWWDSPDLDPASATALTGEWFAQYEEIIDKFKPSNSTISTSIYVSDQADADWKMQNQLRFIRDEPALAFCRDYLMLDYNEVYYSREEAEAEFEKWRRSKSLTAELTKQYTDLCLKLFTDRLKQMLSPGDELYLCDHGDAWSPRYEFLIYAPNDTAGPTEFSMKNLRGWNLIEPKLKAIEYEAAKQEVDIDTRLVSMNVDITFLPVAPSKFITKVS